MLGWRMMKASAGACSVLLGLVLTGSVARAEQPGADAAAAPVAAPSAEQPAPASVAEPPPGAPDGGVLPGDATPGALYPAAPAPLPAADTLPGEALEPELPLEALEAIAPDVPPAGEEPTDATHSVPIRYVLEGVRVRGNSTRTDVIAHFVPIKPGEQFDVDDPTIESIRWRLLGTGWFEDVKLSLARGSRRGWVVLVIDVRERNTLVIDRLVLGLSRVVTNSRMERDTVRPYAGLGLAETNLFGLGIGVTGAAVVSPRDDGISQYGIDFGYHDPMLRGTGFSLSGRFFHNYAREFFGRNPLVWTSCGAREQAAEPDPCDPDLEGARAVVVYHRTGLGIGTGHDISRQLRYTLDWLGEFVSVGDKPAAASTQRGSEIVPIDFRIEGGTSFVSSLRLGFVYDRRDHPALTTRGTLAGFSARFASAVLGSSYDFARFEGTVRHWAPLPWNHVISFGLFLGTVFGNAPFFYDFYAADLSDLLPSRVLELNLDRRRTLNMLGTSIVEMDMEDLAGRLDFEYQLPLYRRGSGFVHGVDAYAGAGIFMLASRRDLRIAVAGYEGLARVPVDLTFDLGVQADTEIGLFRLGFSSLIGFSKLGQENP